MQHLLGHNTYWDITPTGTQVRIKSSQVLVKSSQVLVKKKKKKKLVFWMN